jgi:glyoxylase-like metal-dependent hydrolase (beta-lactamase superfamily II)
MWIGKPSTEPIGSAFSGSAPFAKKQQYPKGNKMYGDIIEVASQTWMVEGRMPSNILKEPDIANALVHKAGDTVYVIDAGATFFFRQRMKEAVEQCRPFRRLVLLNSHSHPDHTPNNVIVREISADEKAHFMPAMSFFDLDFHESFLNRYRRVGEYYDLLDGPRFPYSLAIRPLKLLRVIGVDPFKFILKRSMAKFGPFDVSVETARPFEDKPAERLPIQSSEWTGWNLDDSVYVMEAYGHSPDEVVFFLPKVKVLMLADESVPTFNCWPESNSARVNAVLGKAVQMLEVGEATVLVDSHTHTFFRENAAMTYLKKLLSDYARFKEIVTDILVDHPEGVTINRIYAQARRYADEPVIRKFLAYEFPNMPGFLKTTITCLLLELGAETVGPAGSKRFVLAKSE